jgi:hypothetical protein
LLPQSLLPILLLKLVKWECGLLLEVFRFVILLFFVNQLHRLVIRLSGLTLDESLCSVLAPPLVLFALFGLFLDLFGVIIWLFFVVVVVLLFRLWFLLTLFHFNISIIVESF